MSDATLNEEIARLEIEIDAVRDALDEAIKRNETLEAEADILRGQRDAAIADYNDALAEIEGLRKTLRDPSTRSG
jgi:regulator of replication initiation timing